MFFVSELTILVGLALFLGSVFILTGFFSFLLFGVLLAGSQIGLALSAVLSAFIGSPASKWGVDAALGMQKLTQKYEARFGLTAILGSFTGLALPVGAGIIYFTHPGPSVDLTRLMFQYLLVWTFLIQLVFAYPIMIGTITFEQLPEEARTRFFVAQLGGFVPTTLYLALAAWAFGFGGRGASVSTAEASFAISSQLILLMIAYFTLLILIPFFLGSRRGRKWRLAHLQERNSWAEKLCRILKAPILTKHLPDIQQAEKDLEERIGELSREFEEFQGKLARVVPATPMQLRSSVLRSQAELRAVLAAELKRSPERDPGFEHVSRLRETAENTRELAKELEAEKIKAKLESTTERWLRHFQDQITDIAKETASETTAKRAPALTGTAIATPIVSFVVTTLGGWLWSMISSGFG